MFFHLDSIDINMERGKESFRIKGIEEQLKEKYPPLTSKVKPMQHVIDRYFMRSLVSNDFNLTETAKQLAIARRTARIWLKKIVDSGDFK